MARDPNEPAVKFFCPCCGYRGLWQNAYTELPPPPFDDLGDPPYVGRFGYATFGCCDCCGYEFGYDCDAGACGTPRSFAVYRAQWLASGAPWFSTNRPKPPGWSPTEQFRASGIPPG